MWYNIYVIIFSSYLEPDPHILLSDMRNSKSKWHQKYAKLTEAIGEVIENFSLVRFYPLNIKDEESIDNILITIDNIIQYGEDADVKIRDFDEPEEDDDWFVINVFICIYLFFIFILYFKKIKNFMLKKVIIYDIYVWQDIKKNRPTLKTIQLFTFMFLFVYVMKYIILYNLK